MSELIELTSYEVLDDWGELDAAYRRLKTDFIAFCRLVAGMPEKQKDIAERYAVSTASLSKWVAIGRNEKMFLNEKLLPEDRNTLYLLTTLPEAEFDKAIETGAINPNMSRADAKALKPTKQPAKPKQDAEERRVEKLEYEVEKLAAKCNGLPKKDREYLSRKFASELGV